MAVGDRKDPYLAFNFRVEIDGLQVGGFTEVSGLQIEVESKDYREGGVNEYVHRLAGPMRYPANLVLKHGLMDSETLWSWIQDIKQGKIQRKDGAVALLDSAGNQQSSFLIGGNISNLPIQIKGLLESSQADDCALNARFLESSQNAAHEPFTVGLITALTFERSGTEITDLNPNTGGGIRSVS